MRSPWNIADESEQLKFLMFVVATARKTGRVCPVVSKADDFYCAGIVAVGAYPDMVAVSRSWALSSSVVRGPIQRSAARWT